MLKALALLATVGASVSTAHAQDAMPRLDQVAGNIAYPVGIVNADDGSNRLFIVSQEGRIFVTRGPSKSVFLDITELTDANDERGLLGLVFAPGYAESGKFYIQYTDNTDNSTVVA